MAHRYAVGDDDDDDDEHSIDSDLSRFIPRDANAAYRGVGGDDSNVVDRLNNRINLGTFHYRADDDVDDDHNDVEEERFFDRACLGYWFLLRT
jgi:hypothetical protein